MMRVLVTRPARAAKRTAEKLAALGHEAVVDPLLTIEPVPFEPAWGAFRAAAITSANAIEAAGREKLAPYVSLPLFAVGAESAAAAREAGFRETIACGGDARSLARTLRAQLPAGARVLYLAGAERAQNLAALAAPAEIEIETKVVYRAVPAARFRTETLVHLSEGRIDAVLHYSRRSAEIFLRLVPPETAAALVHLCLSDAAAAPLAQAGFDAKVAAHPDEDALFALLR
jgi:uroporphyrinogen-III synthase